MMVVWNALSVVYKEDLDGYHKIAREQPKNLSADQRSWDLSAYTIRAQSFYAQWA